MADTATLKATRARARYPVGKDTRVRGLMNLLPVRLRDRLIAAVMAKASA